MTKGMNYPMTAAIRVLESQGVKFEPHLYSYEEKGGTEHSARELNVEEHAVVKTLIMETDARTPLVVLMHGDRQVSTKGLARIIGAKTVSPCKPEVADKHSGYKVGGTSPFGTKKAMPVYMEESIGLLQTIYINGGSRGFLISLSPEDVIKVLKPILVNIAFEG